MAHAVAHQGMSGSHGNRRSKQYHNRNFEALLGVDNSRRSGSRPPVLRSQRSGLPMGATMGVFSTSSSTYSGQSRQASVTCTKLLCLRVVSVLAAVAGTIMIFFGLFLNTGTPVLGLCIPGGLLIIAVLLLWCVVYVWYGKYCSKYSDSATLGGPPTEGATQRHSRGATQDTTVNLPLSPVMASYGPDTRLDHQHPSTPPPCYFPVDRSPSFPTKGQDMEQPPSTPPPPYNEVT
ncbi:uncharacterized protein LOC110978279 [Acanthaster planci]|uniref:Uncharacterized protein LOC110978279 n=1 Tax=Acanthaster planci TaxID=133434 RepID=A0A8B7YAW4_ACAPL|nr:uncharacterized protein LOC110978279 [Acanthaster planci]